MYRILGREVIGKGRLGKYVVEISRPWPERAKNIYVIGNFSSLYPGFYKLRKRGNRGYFTIKLWPGTYVYGFIVDNDFENKLDPENTETKCITIPFNPDKEICLSKMVINEPANPLELVYHNENEAGFLHRFLNKYVIRLLVPNIVEEVLLDTGSNLSEPVTKHSIGKYNVYEFHIGITDPLRYRFRFRYGDVEYYYGDEGVGEYSSYIVVEKNMVRGYEKPLWFMGTIYYQIFVDSFENGDPSNDPPFKIRSITPREYGYYGGDLRGIINHIDYLKTLGVETLYLTPIFKASSYHRYDTIDYKEIDKYVGTLNDLKELANILHNNGMRIILDVTIHHTNPCNELFVKAVREGEDSPYWKMFNFIYKPPKEILDRFLKYISGDTCRIKDVYRDPLFKDEKPFYEAFFTIWSMAKFNHDNPYILSYFLDITRYWMDMGIDGFRIDVAMGIPYSWLKQYYLSIKSFNKEFLVLGEVSEDPIYYMDYFDSVMNYYLRMHIFEHLIYHRISIYEFISRLNKLYSLLPYYKIHALYNHLGSHDTPRIKTVVRGRIDLLKLLYVLIFILPGSPAIYYGDEIGLEGGNDPDNRRPMIWDEDLWDHDLLGHIRKLIKIRSEWSALRYGFYSLGVINDKVLFVKRWLRGEVVYSFLNTSSEGVNIEKEIPLREYHDLYNNTVIGKINMVKKYLDPYGFLIIGSRN
jgi:cyclomaltodextrinase